MRSAPDPGQGSEEQGRPSPFRIAGFDLLHEGIAERAGCSTWASRRVSCPRPVPGSTTATHGSATGAKRRASSSRPIPVWLMRSRTRSAVAWRRSPSATTGPLPRRSRRRGPRPRLTGWPGRRNPGARPPSRALRRTPSRRSRSPAGSSERDQLPVGGRATTAPLGYDRRGRVHHARTSGADRLRR